MQADTTGQNSNKGCDHDYSSYDGLDGSGKSEKFCINAGYSALSFYNASTTTQPREPDLATQQHDRMIH